MMLIPVCPDITLDDESQRFTDLFALYHFLTPCINPNSPSVYPEAEDGLQTDACEGLECGGDAGVLGAHCFGTARLH